MSDEADPPTTPEVMDPPDPKVRPAKDPLEAGGLFRVRTAIPHDTGAIRNVAQVTWTHTYREIYTSSYIERMLDRAYSHRALDQAIRNQDGIFLVATTDNVVGFSEVSVARHGWELLRIYVLPMAQGKGVGAALLDRAEVFLRDRGIEHYFARVDAANDEAHGFYRCRGFVEMDEKRVGKETFWDRRLD